MVCIRWRGRDGILNPSQYDDCEVHETNAREANEEQGPEDKIDE